MTKKLTIPATQNDSWGFWGAMNDRAVAAWPCAEAKDYRDIAAMVNAGISLARGLASACQRYGPNFQPSESLKALVYFNEGDLKTLTAAEQQYGCSTSPLLYEGGVLDTPTTREPVRIHDQQVGAPLQRFMHG